MSSKNEMPKKYDFSQQEPLIFKMWEEGNLFSPEGAQNARKQADLETKGEQFSVLMPPPNANAPLHCGHATYSIQDLMIRFKRMQGYKTVYFPGTDHAGFETQVVYERQLKKEGKSRFDFDRERLFNQILDFVKENSDVAINQLKRLGMSADWERNTFMLDDHVVKTVYDTFQKMHGDGLIYRDYYMVNYSPRHGTTFSNLETAHVETTSPLYYVKYEVKETGDFITIATVRPETIYADVAIAINPKDARFKNLVGKTAINPLNNKEMSIIEDSYVDPEFGTGALKITPGHDFNDYEIGKKHGLEMISVVDLNGRMTEEASEVKGLKVHIAREKMEEILQSKSALEKIDENYKNNLLVDYKDHHPIEPMLLPNWFVKMDPLAKKAIKAVQNNDVAFNKPTWKKQMLDWLTNIRDWPISRQIVFGIRIPVWYSIKENPNLHVVFLDKNGNSHDGKISTFLDKFDLIEIEQGLQKVITTTDATYKISNEKPGKDYLPETDTFDTWFSSAQWPLTTTKYPEGEDFKTYYPTSFMDSMWDILFFWISRMIFMGLYITDDVPFKNVYIHGRIDDEQGRKMSKSFGNVIDPIEYVEKYGADALRMGILVGGNTAAKRTSLSEQKVKGYRNFANKIWNMCRFTNLMFDHYDGDVPVYSAENYSSLGGKDQDIICKLNNLIESTTKNLEKHRFKAAGDNLYHFMWDELASDYLEHVKDREDKDLALSILRHCFINGVKMLHPFMPFVTEAVWEHIPGNENTSKLIVSDWPVINK